MKAKAIPKTIYNTQKKLHIAKIYRSAGKIAKLLFSCNAGAFKHSSFYIVKFVAAPTVALMGDEDVPLLEKWNFEPTMGVVEDVPNFRDWVDKLLKIAPMDGRSWKILSQRFGWKVKTHGFAIQGVIAEAVATSRISLERAQKKILSSLSKRKAVNEQDSEEKEDEGSLVSRPRARRRIISYDEEEVSPSRSIPLTESVEALKVILDDDVAPAAAHASVEQFFISGFGGEASSPVLDEAPLASFSTPMSVTPSLPISAVSVPPLTVFTTCTVPTSTVPPTVIHHAEVGSSSRSGAMRQVVIKVTTEGNLLRKSGQADV
uniref:Uncharacterized protein isoform X1 n=2 Tax=Nicotiana tabacum TaxID=4097 RepID=A0A1S4D7S7_TOBAC|nr:PREDICTED: uncharacterized protein LOC107826960 isoform X1 [Nicotiana tabacum]XP_016509490.1 PREDICTED: uncharacterized protein LOC107826960 isoform X1 [Nicotiana tabacum]